MFQIVPFVACFIYGSNVDCVTFKDDKQNLLELSGWGNNIFSRIYEQQFIDFKLLEKKLYR